MTEICQYCACWTLEEKHKNGVKYRKCTWDRNYHAGYEPCSIRKFEREPGSDDDKE